MAQSGPVGYRGKRALDLGSAAVLLIATSVIQLVVGAAVWVVDGRPIYFSQLRPGLHGRRFRLWKFRTMRTSADTSPAMDRQRLTRLGSVLRSLSLDELPELWNVFRGDMSLVGPRPLLMQYVDRYTPEQARRMEVRPGLTGLAQVEGRNALTWEQKFALDVWYVDNASLWLDLKIIARTVGVVFRRQGISAQGEATMPEFMGSPSRSEQ